jgi:hypothetical protein
MDQPSAERALKEIEVLVGEWSQAATPAGGEPWPGEAKATKRSLVQIQYRPPISHLVRG